MFYNTISLHKISVFKNNIFLNYFLRTLKTLPDNTLTGMTPILNYPVKLISTCVLNKVFHKKIRYMLNGSIVFKIRYSEKWELCRLNKNQMVLKCDAFFPFPLRCIYNNSKKEIFTFTEIKIVVKYRLSCDI